MTAKAGDRDPAGLSAAERWREWMGRVEAVIFAAARPVPRRVLAGLVGEECDLDRLIVDIRAELADRPYDLVEVAGGWQHRTRPRYAGVIRGCEGVAAAPALAAWDAALLMAVAWHQPVTRADLERLMERAVAPEVLSRLRRQELIGAGPRSPRPGSPPTWVTTAGFLERFGLASLGDLPGPETWENDLSPIIPPHRIENTE
ncbi:MAG: SMC-Scp complex subunit ScpB [Caulobacter sp.]|nr:SMC-Scp complex subunit ScpB [Caulobacter sp.]